VSKHPDDSLGRRSPEEILLGVGAKSVARAVEPGGQSPALRVLIEDFRPLAETLEWKLAATYWKREGLRPFAEQAVPYTVNNSGWAARNAAEVLHVACRGFPADGSPIRVLELGSGLGLFARLLLDAFRRRCAADDADYYERLRYHVTDGSARTVEQWREHGLFDEHTGRVVTGTCDAADPTRWTDADGREHALPRMHAVFGNYVLDNLRTAVIRKIEGRLEQLHLRTWLGRHEEPELRARTGLTCDEVAEIARSAGDADLERLLPATTFFQLEASFDERGVNDLPYLEQASEICPESQRTMLSHGAIRCLETCLERLEPGGFVWVADVGPPDTESVDRQVHVSRFGASIAANVNFPLLARCLSDRGYDVLTPDGDERRLIHARLLGKGLEAEVRAAFLARFRLDPESPLDRLPIAVTEHIAAGRHDEALGQLRSGLALFPDDWNLLTHAAQFLNQQLLEHEKARELARRAAERNPWFSSFVWNTLGNCEFCVGDADEAHRCYLRGREIDPTDPQSHLNLAYTFARAGDYGEALESIGRALLRDSEGRFETVLLEKQREVLGLIAARRTADADRLRRREEVIALTR
jgi:tetratricopeptide (TPR) repeat protein